MARVLNRIVGSIVCCRRKVWKETWGVCREWRAGRLAKASVALFATFNLTCIHNVSSNSGTHHTKAVPHMPRISHKPLCETVERKRDVILTVMQ